MLAEGVAAEAAAEALDVAFCVDDNYLPHAFVLMGSILDAHPLEWFNFWVVMPNAANTAEYERPTERLGEKASVRYLHPDGAEWRFGLSGRATATHISEAMYLRILLPELLPDSVTRVLYLDADILATSDGLARLFALDMRGLPVAAVRDAFTRRLVDTTMLPGLRERPHMDPQAPYFNSGVLLIDTGEWKSCKVRERCEEYLRETAGVRRFPDQDALNVALYGKWMRLRSQFNNMMASRIDDVAGSSLSDAVLVHSTGPMKHWQPGFPAGGRTVMYARIRDRLFSAQDSAV